MTAREANADLLAEIAALRDRVVSLTRENTDLHGALAQANQREAATSEILQVISGSLTDVQPVFDAIADSSRNLLRAWSATVYRYEDDLIHLAAARGGHPGLELALREEFPRRPAGNWGLDRCCQDATVAQIADVELEPDSQLRDLARRRGWRASLVVPMLRDGQPIGMISVARAEAGAFLPAEIDLLQTFADQAVIAIENVRLFKELETRNAELTTALERQTATSEILRVISGAQQDAQAVFDTIVQSAVRLCGATTAAVFRVENGVVYHPANYGGDPEALAAARARYPRPVDIQTMPGMIVLARSVVQIPDSEEVGLPDHVRQVGRILGFRSVVGVPMLREGEAIGALLVTRREPGRFSDAEVELLKTFSDQAVIAIENVRLFTELREKNDALTVAHERVTEALEQQTATSAILTVIASSPTDVQPVLEAVAENAARLCHTEDASILQADRGVFRVMAYRGAARLKDFEGTQVSRGSVAGRAILDGQVVHVHNITQESDAEFSVSKALMEHFGHSTMLAAPLLRQGTAIGAIFVRRTQVDPFSDRQIALLQTFADQAVIAIENVRLFTELEARNKDLTEALEQQTATSEILRSIAQAQTDTQPVFDTIVRNAAQLCRAANAAVFLRDGNLLDEPANFGRPPEVLAAARSRYPRPLAMDTASGMAILTRSVVHVPDTEAPSAPELVREIARSVGFRSVVSVPMLREGDAMGAINVTRPEPGRFSDAEVQLLKTFADQAVIAIENVRLFKELEARNRDLTTALDQQTATSEILQVISRSPTDVQPVFDTIIRSAVRLLGGFSGLVTQIIGDDVHLAALTSTNPSGNAAQKALWPRPVKEDVSVHGHVITSLAPSFITDVESDRSVPPSELAVARARGWRSIVAVPLLRDGRAIGSLAVTRSAPGAFADGQVALLQTFADQAVIAIENVRLFTELQARNRDLTAALDRQTATAEVLRVISQSQTEVQPVFDAIVDHAIRLFRAWSASVARSDGQFVQIIATRGGLPGSAAYILGAPPGLIHEAMPIGRCIATRTVVHIPNIESDSTLDHTIPDLARARGWRSVLVAPMLRDGQPIGAIAITRAEVGPFSPAEIELLQTFADQAVIAVENTRLLGELRARTGELTRSVAELTALGEVSRALSSTLDLDRVLQTIVTRASQLAGTDACSVFEYDEATEAFHLRATNNLDEEVVALARQTPTRKGEGVQGRMAVTRQPVQVPDIGIEDAYHGPLRDILLRTGTRAVLAIPMLRENELIGGLTVNKRTPGEFSPEVIELLTTFATQSALAIQNARLYREIEQKSRELEAASQHKSEFLANMSHELRTPLNAIIGFSEVLSEKMFGELNEKQEEYSKDIHASGQHLLSLINDILDLSKIEAGRMELEVSDFDLPMAIDNAMTLIRERAARRSIALYTTVDERLGQVQGDERKIRQVLLNLLSNAIKFTPEGGRIEVAAKPVDGSIEVSVSDTGVGIAPQDQEAVFEEFRQVGTADKKVEGTGLGLALSRKFIELHGGRIWVKSEVGQGSTFTFTVPVRRGA